MNVILEGVVGSIAYGLNHKGSDVLSLNKPQETYHKTQPDSTYHEVEKFMKLALRGNPTILEALFLEGYTVLTKRGGEYANGMKSRYEKNTRHIYRLLQQGRELLETGNLTVRVNNREELFEIGKLPPDKVVDKFEQDFAAFDKVSSVLPDKPDYKRINKMLIKIRKEDW